MINIWEHPEIIVNEAVHILSYNKYNNITSVIDSPGFKLYNKGTKKDGVEHITVINRITVRDSQKTCSEFIEKILKPLINKLAEIMKKTLKNKKEYALFILPLPEDKIAASCLYHNLGLRMIKNYNLRTLSTEISIDIALIEKGNI